MFGDGRPTKKSMSESMNVRQFSRKPVFIANVGQYPCKTHRFFTPGLVC